MPQWLDLLLKWTPAALSAPRCTSQAEVGYIWQLDAMPLGLCLGEDAGRAKGRGPEGDFGLAVH